MSFLLDTHIFIWAMDHEEMLTQQERDVLSVGAGQVYVSVASFWEMSIKIGQGKLRFVKSLDVMVDESPFDVLPISVEDAVESGRLPLIHRDPFDRMLIAQAKRNNLTLITRDPFIRQYDVRLLEG
jgi:PIN domain nuclease of toxin-antitoxin system